MPSTSTCQGIQHTLVQRLLSSSETCYAAFRGMAVLYWKYDSNKMTWHAHDCIGSTNTMCGDAQKNCIYCCTVQNNICKDIYPWLFGSVKVMPSNTDILHYIQHLYLQTTSVPPTETHVDVDEDFLCNNTELRKLLLIVDKETTIISLIGSCGSHCYLI